VILYIVRFIDVIAYDIFIMLSSAQLMKSTTLLYQI